MIDVVANNMAFAGDAAVVKYDQFVPFNKPEYFHNLCQISNYTNYTNAQDV